MSFSVSWRPKKRPDYKAPAHKPPQTLPPTRDKVFKYQSLGGDISHLNHHPSQIPATHECEGYISNTGTFGEHMKTIADSIVAIISQGPMMQLSIGAHYELHTSPFSAMDSLNIAGCKWHVWMPQSQDPLQSLLVSLTQTWETWGDTRYPDGSN